MQPSSTKNGVESDNSSSDNFLASTLFENLRKLLTIVDELRDVGL